jgi:hypothetical protein
VLGGETVQVLGGRGEQLPQQRPELLVLAVVVMVQEGRVPARHGDEGAEIDGPTGLQHSQRLRE